MKPFQFLCLFCCLVLINCKSAKKLQSDQDAQIYVTVLGIAQDGGYPHINNPDEFKDLENGKLTKRKVVSLGLVDNYSKKKWMFEATPDLPQQLYDLEKASFKSGKLLDGVFLTHAHIGHYTGLMYLGREALGGNEITVYCMPRMAEFLKYNQPWKQLVDLKNIKIEKIYDNAALDLSPYITVTPIQVPHRDEFSETVGYKIEGYTKTLLFIPDINKWNLWEKNIVEEVKKVDYALLDATFYEDGEIPRPMSEVPHPFIVETMALFKNQPVEVRNKIYFIHLNHSNPVLEKNSKASKLVQGQGFHIAEEGFRFKLN